MHLLFRLLEKLCAIPRIRIAASALLVALTEVQNAHAGSIADNTQEGLDRRSALEAVADTPFGFGNGSFVVAPIPMRSPMFGTGLTLGGGYLFQSDAGSNTSFLGLAGLKTSNGTNGYGAGGKLSFSDNRWQTKFFLGEVDAFYDAFPLGVPVAINQSGSLGLLSGSYGFNRHISAGLEISQLDTQIRRDGSGVLPSDLLPDADLNIVTLNLVFAADYRDDSLYPTEGSHLQVTAGQGRTVDGASREFEKAVLTFDRFISGLGPGVIAMRVAACGVTDNTPFFEKCSIGGSDAFRGYNAFETLGDRLLSAQIAYRGQLGARFGYSVFGGFGNTADSFSELGDTDIRYAAGIGGRFRLSRKFPMDLAVDLVRNRDGENYTYIYVGQRF
jgi:outer membrane protein assembly factor BamA